MRQFPVVIVFVMVVAGHPASAAIRDDVSPGNIPELERRIRQTLERTKTPGASVAIVSRDRELWASGIGKADLSDGTPATACARCPDKCRVFGYRRPHVSRL